MEAKTKEQKVKEIENESNKRMNELGLENFLFSKTNDGVEKVFRKQLLWIDFEQLKKFYKNDGRERIVEKLNFFLTYKKIELYNAEMDSIKHRFEFYTIVEDSSFVTSYNEKKTENVISSNVIELIADLGFPEEAEKIKIMRVFCEEEAINQLEIFLETHRGKYSAYREEVRSDLQDRVEAIHSWTDRRFKLNRNKL